MIHLELLQVGFKTSQQVSAGKRKCLMVPFNRCSAGASCACAQDVVGCGRHLELFFGTTASVYGLSYCSAQNDREDDDGLAELQELRQVQPSHFSSQIPQRLDTSFSIALHSINIRHSLLFSAQRLRDRVKRIPAERCQCLQKKTKTFFPEKERQKKGKREATPHLLEPTQPYQA